MPKKPPRDNPGNRAPRTVQSAAKVLRRLTQLRESAGISLDKQPVEKALAGLPPELRAQVVGTVDKPEELVIFTASAAWAARLKLALAGGPGATGGRRITVKVAPRGASVRQPISG